MDEQSEEYLFDIQPGALQMSGIEQRLITLLTKMMAGGVMVAYSISEISSEIRRYRHKRGQR